MTEQQDPSSTENILVTGATGLIGFEVSRQLSEQGLRPRLLVRRPERAGLLASFDAKLIQGDLTLSRTLENATRDIDTVIHLGARATFESYRILKPTILDGSLDLMKAAIENGVQNFVFASSIFVYESQQEPIDRTTSPSPQLAYGKLKWEAEQRLSELAREGDVRLANIRLPHVYGPQDLLFTQIRKGWVIFPGDLNRQCGHLHVRDAARALIEVGRRGWEGTSPVADRHNTSWEEFFEVTRQYYDRFRMISIPKALARLGMVMMRPLFMLRKGPDLFTWDTITGFNLNLPIDPDCLWDDIQLSPAYESIHEGIPAVLNDYVHFRWKHPVLDRR